MGQCLLPDSSLLQFLLEGAESNREEPLRQFEVLSRSSVLTNKNSK